MEDIISQIESATIPAEGIEEALVALLAAGDIDSAKELFQNRDDEVMEAIREYEPTLHGINYKEDKKRGNGAKPYITNKLPLSYQQYINHIAVFFMLGKPIIWRNAKETSDDGDINAEDEAFSEFKEILKDTRHYTGMREAKRLAGSETECAKVYHVYKDSENKPKIKAIVISRSKGYTLRPMFDQYGDMIAFAYGYTSSYGDKTKEHFNIYTPGMVYKCTKEGSWTIAPKTNPIGKIPVIYYAQQKEWEGVEPLIERMEKVKSSESDANDYFSDPMLLVSSNFVESLPDVNVSGRAIQLDDITNGAAYLEPPTALEMKKNEKDGLDESILMFSMTPDFSYENLKGLGTLSGEAIKRALIPAYIKRDNRLEIYEELLDREVNVILAIMKGVTHIGLRTQIDDLKIEFEFAEPFVDDAQTLWKAVGTAVTDKVMSRYTAVDLIGQADDTTEELERIANESSYQDELNIFPSNQGDGQG